MKHKINSIFGTNKIKKLIMLIIAMVSMNTIASAQCKIYSTDSYGHSAR